MSKKGYILTGFVAALIAAIIVFGSMSVISSAESGRPYSEKHYISYEIQNGDSLWSIAENFTDGWNVRPADYVSELKSVNGLQNDLITSGSHLIVICYQ